jgi:hypothetical protein
MARSLTCFVDLRLFPCQPEPEAYAFYLAVSCIAVQSFDKLKFPALRCAFTRDENPAIFVCLYAPTAGSYIPKNNLGARLTHANGP